MVARVFIAALGLSRIAAGGGLLFVAVHRPQQLQHAGSVVVAYGGMWNVPRPGIEPVSPALADRFLSTVPPGSPGRDV